MISKLIAKKILKIHEEKLINIHSVFCILDQNISLILDIIFNLIKNFNKIIKNQNNNKIILSINIHIYNNI